MEGGDKGGYPDGDGEWFVYISYFKLFTLSFCLLHQSSGILLAPNFPLPQFGWEEEGRRQKRKFTWNQNSDARSLRNLVNTSYIHVKQTQHSFNLHIIHHPSAIHEMYSRWSKGREVDICVQTAGTSSRVCCTAVIQEMEMQWGWGSLWTFLEYTDLLSNKASCETLAVNYLSCVTLAEDLWNLWSFQITLSWIQASILISISAKLSQTNVLFCAHFISFRSVSIRNIRRFWQLKWSI